MSREVLVNINGKEETIGIGAKAFRSIGTNEHTNFDPFLLIDELLIDPDRGLPDHPHRGIEALTYVLKGQSINEDSNGYMSVIGSGDVQCITVGKGVMHGIMPIGREPCRSVQLWLNLPKKFKMIEPMYQDIKNTELPKAFKDGVHIKVLAGRSGDLKSPLKTLVPIIGLEFKLDRNVSFNQPLPNEWAAFVYILEGTGAFGRLKRIEGSAHSTLLLTKGNGIFFKNTSSTNQLHLLLFAGQQLNEPVFRKGPYIMNSQNEINEAIKDFEQGKNGFEKAHGWKSQAIKRITPTAPTATPNSTNTTNNNTTNNNNINTNNHNSNKSGTNNNTHNNISNNINTLTNNLNSISLKQSTNTNASTTNNNSKTSNASTNSNNTNSQNHNNHSNSKKSQNN